MNKNVLLETTNMVETVIKYVNNKEVYKVYGTFNEELRTLSNQLFSISCEEYELHILRRIKFTKIALQSLLLVIQEEYVIQKNDIEMLKDLINDYDELYKSGHKMIFNKNA